MLDFINNPQWARQCYDKVPSSARQTFKRFSASDFVRFAQAAYRVLLQNKLYLARKNRLSLNSEQRSQNQSIIARNTRWIRNGLDLSDCQKGLIYQGNYANSLRALKKRIEKMAVAYGFELPTDSLDETQKPVRLFQIFDKECVRPENMAQSRRLDWASRQTLAVYIKANRSFIRSM